MDRKPQQFFGMIEPPEHLLRAVLGGIDRAVQRRAQRAMLLLGVLAAASGLLLIAAVSYVWQELYASGFYDYLMLLWSDSVAREHWQEILASVAASVPSIAVLIIIGCIAAMWWSIARMPRIIRTMRIA